MKTLPRILVGSTVMVGLLSLAPAWQNTAGELPATRSSATQACVQNTAAAVGAESGSCLQNPAAFVTMGVGQLFATVAH